jgi:release factor glutamine methyltransferase
MSIKTIREAYRQASSLLSRNGIDEARRQAELLIQHALGWNRTEFLLRWDEPYPEEKEILLERMLDRRLSGEPLQYIIGEQEFYGLPFHVNRSVLIPRPETELLVEAVMRRGEQMYAGADDAPRVIDIGTGSGAIAVTLAVHRPTWRITASDISEEALRVAETNARRHGVHDRIAWVCGDLLAPWLERGDGKFPFDILVSNPPYIAEDEIGTLQVEVRQYEPYVALNGGADGLRIYDRLIDQLRRLSARPRIVALEVGKDQHEAVMRMLEDVREWDDISVVPDLAGIMRHVVAVRTEA